MDPAPLHHSNRCPLHFDLMQTAAGVVNHYQTPLQQTAGWRTPRGHDLYQTQNISHSKYEQQRYHG